LVNRIEKRNVAPLEGKSALLSLFNEGHIDGQYLSWLKDVTVTRYLVGVGADTPYDDIKQFCESLIASPDDYFFAIQDRANGQHIGNVRLGGIDWSTSTSAFGIMIGEPNAQGKGFASDALRLIERFCFEGLDLRRLQFPVVQENQTAMRLYERSGYFCAGKCPQLFSKDAVSLPMVTFMKTQEGFRKAGK